MLILGVGAGGTLGGELRGGGEETGGDESSFVAGDGEVASVGGFWSLGVGGPERTEGTTCSSEGGGEVGRGGTKSSSGGGEVGRGGAKSSEGGGDVGKGGT